MKITEFKFMYDCPSCGNGCEFIKTSEGICRTQAVCPHCGFDMRAYEKEQEQKHTQYIEENPHCQLRYDILTADECEIKKHPQEQMLELGYRLIDSIPQSIADCWWFTVDEFIEPLPPYLRKIRYEIGCP